MELSPGLEPAMSLLPTSLAITFAPQVNLSDWQTADLVTRIRAATTDEQIATAIHNWRVDHKGAEWANWCRTRGI